MIISEALLLFIPFRKSHEKPMRVINSALQGGDRETKEKVGLQPLSKTAEFNFQGKQFKLLVGVDTKEVNSDIQQVLLILQEPIFPCFSRLCILSRQSLFFAFGEFSSHPCFARAFQNHKLMLLIFSRPMHQIKNRGKAMLLFCLFGL